jgi:hypothetical protein
MSQEFSGPAQRATREIAGDAHAVMCSLEAELAVKDLAKKAKPILVGSLDEVQIPSK